MTSKLRFPPTIRARWSLATGECHAQRDLRFAGVADLVDAGRGLGMRLGVTSPMLRIHASLYPSMKTRLRPIAGTSHITMLHRIPMHVVEMMLKIRFVFDRVLPKPWLPNASSTLLSFRFRNRLLTAADRHPMLRELFLDPSQPLRILRITRWHRPNRVPMIGQQDDR